MKTTIEQWLKQRNVESSRRVEITDHAHGFRVTLYQDFESVSFGVNSSIESAFSEALSNFDVCLKRVIEDHKKRLFEEKKEIEVRLDIISKKLLKMI